MRDQCIIHDTVKNLVYKRSKTYRVIINGLVLSPFLEGELDVGLLLVKWENFENR